MIGYFDYTVWLTYLSAISASIGIVASLSGNGHPYIGTLFLLICGLCDAFDGRVARRKKNRTDSEKNYGIQIDSLSDLVAFGILPACVGFAFYRSSQFALTEAGRDVGLTGRIPFPILTVIMAVYALAALIRLAYYNVTEQQRQQTETGCRETYTGLPVTSAAIVFPAFLAISQLAGTSYPLIYFGLMLVMAVAFLARFRLKKPGLSTILIFVAIGAVEFAILIIARILFHHG
ncbi:MAG: CDP-alcohol phosphatidyltransferase family protein [Firmicutes bacterium]|nr:CDP-alcohol phosphatidyltransferase family protein [Bacillota bacterium]MDY2719632.1 CDP-alcohol phosphatidyltransferase family protein [Candidatus Faecousia sp.]